MRTKSLLTVEVTPSVQERLTAVAQTTARSESWLTQEALSSFLDLYEWQVQAIGVGMADADAGRLVEHGDVEAWLASWGSESELPMPRCE